MRGCQHVSDRGYRKVGYLTYPRFKGVGNVLKSNGIDCGQNCIVRGDIDQTSMVRGENGFDRMNKLLVGKTGACGGHGCG